MLKKVSHAAVADDAQIIDRVGTGGHSANEGRQFHCWVRAFVGSGRHKQPIIDEVEQARVLGQGHDRDEPSGKAEVDVVEGVGHSRGVCD